MYTQNIPKQEHPFIANLKRFSDKPIFGDLERLPKINKGQMLEGLLGNYLLRQITPENMDINLLENMFKFRPKNKNMELGFRQRGKDNMLDLSWRF